MKIFQDTLRISFLLHWFKSDFTSIPLLCYLSQNFYYTLPNWKIESCLYVYKNHIHFISKSIYFTHIINMMVHEIEKMSEIEHRLWKISKKLILGKNVHWMYICFCFCFGLLSFKNNIIAQILKIFTGCLLTNLSFEKKKSHYISV